MLKLPKGLKKKKKGKKSKKDQELFTEEELEQYKREHQSHPVTVVEGSDEHPEKPNAATDDDEWSKFAALTTGVDSILKKTQGDLDRIKSTSFFKRVPPPSEKKEEESKVEEPAKAESSTAASQQVEEEKDPAQELLKAVVEFSESEEESDFDDSAFDTTFIEKVEAGELPLAYVEPEEEETDLGPDPFDTGYAEKVIKGPEVSQRGKRIVNIGAAVEVLTGKVEAHQSSTKSRRQRRGIQNLLLESFEVEQESDTKESLEPTAVTAASVPKTLLDEPPELAEDIPIDLSVSLHLKLQPPKPPKEEGEEELDKDLEEFDVVKKDDDIFNNQAVNLEETEEEAQKRAAQLAETVDWSEFEIEREKPVRPPLPNLVKATSDDELNTTDDPFDTAYVEKIVPKSIEYDDDFDPRAGLGDEDEFDPRAEEVNLFESQGKSIEITSNLTLAKNDLLSASHNDLASIAPTLAPKAEESDQEEQEVDPFDTSAIDSIVAPGKIELKYLEKELLDSEIRKNSLSDDDFDPRAEEEPRPSAEALKHRKSSLSLQIPAAGKLVSFIVPSPDLLHVDSETSSKIQKPLTPYYHRESSLPDDDIPEEDPFDTSFVPVIAPTKLELDLLEKEILKEETLKHSLSDPDFDPRATTPEPPREESRNTDLLYTSHNHDIKVLTPAKDSTPEEIDIDPFDTSIASNILPGKIELKLLEDELIEKKPEAPPPTDILSDTQDNSIYVKILTPQPTGSLDLENQDDFDPFDTSFATNLAPGETEIKLIESELIN